MTKPNVTTPRFLYQRLIRAQNVLAQIKAITEFEQEPASLIDKIRSTVSGGLMSPVEIVVGSINPASAWPSDSVQVEVTVTNRSTTDTSGIVTGDVLQDGFNPIFSSGFGAGKAGALAVTALGPGQKVSGTVTLKQWKATASFLKVGPQDLHLQYWIVVSDNDPRATISIYNPVAHTATNLAPISDAWDSLELYPHCQPNPPEFPAESDYLKISSFQFNGSSTVYIDDYDALTQPLQSVTLSWSVASGGFPPAGGHPGSLSSVVLTGPNLGAGITLPPSGEQTFQMGEIVQAEAAKPFVLTATGNCGKVQASLNARLASRPPVIKFFNVTPNDHDPKLGYVYLGKPATLTWQYTHVADRVSIVGKNELGNTVFQAKKIISYNNITNSLQVTPSDNTKYVLEVDGPGGSATASLSVDVYNVQSTGESVFFFKMTDDDSEVLPCFMLGILAPDKATAEALAKAQNGGYDAEPVDEAQFLAGC